MIFGNNFNFLFSQVICVMGSSANYKNIDIFMQSDASLAVEPRYPQLCQMVKVSSPPKVSQFTLYFGKVTLTSVSN